MRRKARCLNTNEAQLRAIERALKAGQKSKRQIAAELQVSDDVVFRLAKFGRDYRKTASKHARCPGCGGLQTDPCLLCAARAERRPLKLAS